MIIKSKVDRVKLNQMLMAGKTQTECAKHFNVSNGLISQIKKELNINVVKCVALESAHKVLDRHLDTLGQLQKINDNANQILDLLMRWSKGDKEALKILEGGGYKTKDPRNLALKAMGEIRGQLNLQLDIFRTLYDVQAVSDFQKEVLTAIGEEAPDVKEKIIRRLKEGRALRQSVSIH